MVIENFFCTLDIYNHLQKLQGKAILGIQKHKMIVNEYITLVKARLLELDVSETPELYLFSFFQGKA